MSRGPQFGKYVLYLLQQPQSGLVKIGITSDLHGRLRTLQHTTGQELRVLGTYSIGDVEAHCHEIGASHRTLGEWFAPEVLDVLIPWLPKRRGKAFLSRCTECRQWFTVKRGTGQICGAELCRKAQARRVGQAIAQAQPDRGGRRPKAVPIISECLVCGSVIVDRRPRKTCSAGPCASEYGRLTAVPGSSNCTVAGCQKARVSRGLCSKHLYRMRVHGSTDDSAVRSYRSA